MNWRPLFAAAALSTLTACTGARQPLQSGAQPEPVPEPVPVVAAPEPIECVTPEQVTAKQVKYDADFEAASQRALLEKGLKVIELELVSRRAHSGTRRNEWEKELPPMGPEFVNGGKSWRAPRPDPEWIFVQDGDGNVFRPHFNPAKTVVETLQFCDCPPADCSGGSGCPGCFDTFEHWYGPLPEGSTFKHDLMIEVPEHHRAVARAAPTCPVHKCLAKP